MSRQTDSNRLIVPSIAGLYQQLLSGISNYQQLGARLHKEIKVAHAFRRVERVKELATILSNLSIKEYQLIADYYLIWCQCRDCNYDSATLERIIEQTSTYKAKALISRAGFELHQANLDGAFHFYDEAFKTQPTVSEYIDAMKSIAVLKSIEGFHSSALNDLHDLMPLLRYAEPLLYYDVLNSYAVELLEARQFTEAADVSRLVVSSPFAPYYPEWLETAKELREPSRSFLAVNTARESNIIKLTPRSITSEDETVATVLSINDWKESKMPKKKEPPAKVEPTSPRTTKKAFEIRTKILVDNEISESKMDVILGLIDNRKLPQSAIDGIRKILDSHNAD